MARNQRIVWIDFSKVICIYLVVLGHALSYSVTNECYLRNFIYLFHLPVFFFVSGYLQHSAEKNFYAYFLTIVKSLIIPYIFLNILALFLKIPIYLYLHNDFNSQLFYFLIGHGHAPAGPAWFLLCLFWIKFQMFFIIKLKDGMQLLCAFFYCLLAYYFPWHLYWDIDSSFMAMPIFIIGYQSKRHYSECINRHYSSFMMGGIFIITFVITFGFSLIQQKEAMFSRLFGTSGVLFYIAAILGIVMIISLCKLLECFNSKYIMILSSGSIIIMGLHGVFYGYTRAFLKMLNVIPSEYDYLIKIFVCVIVLVEMYFPIILLQRYCSVFIGGRKPKYIKIDTTDS